MMPIGVHMAHRVIAINFWSVQNDISIGIYFKRLKKFLQFPSAHPRGVPLAHILKWMSVEILHLREPRLMVTFGLGSRFKGSLQSFCYDHVAPFYCVAQ